MCIYICISILISQLESLEYPQDILIIVGDIPNIFNYNRILTYSKYECDS